MIRNPDPGWIRIQFSLWFWIQEGNYDPQKRKKENFYEELDVLPGELEASSGESLMEA